MKRVGKVNDERRLRCVGYIRESPPESESEKYTCHCGIESGFRRFVG